MKRTIRLVGKFLFMFFLLGLLFAYAMFEGGFVSWFLFYSFVPVFLYEVAFFLYPIKKWRMSRSFNHYVVRSGDAVHVTIRMKRALPFPLYYTIFEEIFPDSMQKVNLQHDTYRYLNSPADLNVIRRLKHVVFPWFSRHVEKKYVMQEIPRGRHPFQVIRVRISDMFGFMHKEHSFAVRDELIVYPTAREVHMYGRMSAFDHGEQSAYSFRLKSTNIAIGTREYIPGDKFSWIDWKQTARKNELMTKEFEQEKSTDTMIILNACFHKEFNFLAFEAAVEVAYSIVEAIYKQSSEAYFVSIGQDNIHMPIYHDETKKIGLREHLTTIEPFAKKTFAEQFKKEIVHMARGFVIVLVTTRINEAFKHTILQMTSRMKRIIVIFIQGSNQISAEEFGVIREMQFQGVVVNVLTEKELIHHAIEVNVV